MQAQRGLVGAVDADRVADADIVVGIHARDVTLLHDQPVAVEVLEVWGVEEEEVAPARVRAACR